MAYTSAPELNSQKNDYVAAITQGKGSTNIHRLETFTTNFIIVDKEQGPVLRPRPRMFLTGTPSIWGGALSSQVTNVYELVGTNFLFCSVFDGTNTIVRVFNGLSSTNLGSAPGEQGTYFETFTNIAGQSIVIWAIGTSTRGGYNTTTLTNTLITDPDLPASTGAPVFLDGFLFWARSGTNEIYQSDFDNPFSYTPGNFITANIESGRLITLGKIRNYLVAFKTTGTEFFYNAGVASGSVLARNDTFYTTVNLLGSRYYSYQDSLYFIGGDRFSSRRGLYRMSATGQVELFVNPFWDTSTGGISFFNNEFVFGLLEIEGSTYLVIHRTNSPFSTLVTYGPCFWFDLGKKLFLYQTGSPCFSFSDNRHVVFNSNSGQTAQFQPALVGPDATNITPLSNYYLEYQLGNITHNTLNFKTAHSLKVKVTSNRLPDVFQMNYSDDGSIVNNRTRTIYASALNPESNRKDIIVRRLGRYRERNYSFSFFYNTADAFSVWYLNGFEFNISIGTH